MSKNELNKKIHECFSSLEERQPWTASMINLIQHISWETEDILGTSKTMLIKDTIDATLKEVKDGNTDSDVIIKKIKEKHDKQKKNSQAMDKYSAFSSKVLISPWEAQRRLRYFSENLLNHEFDILMNLLPDHLVTKYLQLYFPKIQDNADAWRIYGHSNEFSLSVESAGQHDTIAYNKKLGCLVGLEIKIDADVQKDQLFKYCCMYHDLLEKKFVSAQDFYFLVIATDNLSAQYLNNIKTNAQLTMNDLVSSSAPVKSSLLRYKGEYKRIQRLIDEVTIASTTWQQFGDHFSNVVSDKNEKENNYLDKLINGFLVSLALKYSKKLSRNLYKKAC